MGIRLFVVDDHEVVRRGLRSLLGETGIEIIGEAAGQVSTEGRSEVPDLPWRAITAMRHRLVHAYYDINLDVVWSTVQDDLPPLAATLRQVLERC